ncbi:MAG: restriction endonuclease subunit S [Alphaproteobacteria bacterium]|nr:restriction endonuclease subunit S [Alphaproteobacteria bacterium]
MSGAPWDTTTLSDTRTFRLLGGLWKGKKPPFTRATVVRNTNFADRANLDLSDVAVLDVETRQLADRRLQDGDIIIERSGGGPKQPVGRPAYFQHSNGEPFSFSNFTSVVRVLNRESFLPRFVAYYLLHLYQAGETIPLQRATTGIRNLDWSAYTGLPIVRPPFAEQERIAATLSLVQRAIENEERAIAATRELKQAAMAKIFAVGVGETSAQSAGLGIGPAEWSVHTIREKNKLVAGGTPSRTEPAYWEGGTIPWVKTGEVNYRVIEDTEEKITPLALKESAAKLLPKGTVLVAMYGQGVTRGKVAMLGIEAATNQACVGLLPRDAEVLPEFLYYYLTFSYEKLRDLAHGAQQQNLNADLVGSFRFAVPERSQQSEVIQILNTVDRSRSLRELRLKVLRELFATLLDKLMTGEIPVDQLDIDTSTVAAA